MVEAAFAPVPVLRAPFFDREVVGTEMLDRLAGEVFDGNEPAEVLHASWPGAGAPRPARPAPGPALRREGEITSRRSASS